MSRRPPQPPRRLGEDRFWALIERSRQADPEEHALRLAAILEERPLAEIVEFDRCFQERLREAFRADLLAVCGLMNDGASIDSFDYFLSWLVLRGHAAYTAALADPALAAAGVRKEDGPFECELAAEVAARAYEAKTGRGDYSDAVAPRVPRRLRGRPLSAAARNVLARRLGLA